MNKLFLFLSLFLLCSPAFAADSLNVLFIGNSYVGVNDLPTVVANIAAADGRVLNKIGDNPGGMTLEQHFNSPATQAYIQQGNWDFVVLQEQSQLPSFPEGQVQSDFYPWVMKLDSLIHVYNPCAKTVLYITWGRKNGDQGNCPYFPPLCTYQGMDSLLTLRYTQAAQMTGAYLSPVGPLWHALREQTSIELYQADESHPTNAGTYAAALSFYSVLFHADVLNNSYNYPSVSSTDAGQIRQISQALVSDSLHFWYRFGAAPVMAGFTIDSSASNGNEIAFQNESQNATGYLWDFGDGQTDTLSNPVHEFEPGNYTVCLTAFKDCDSEKICQNLMVTPTAIVGLNPIEALRIYPNPVQHELNLNNLKTPGTYVIYDFMGRNLLNGAIRNNHINVESLLPGIYLLKINTPEGWSKSVKFQKQ